MYAVQRARELGGGRWGGIARLAPQAYRNGAAGVHRSCHGSFWHWGTGDADGAATRIRRDRSLRAGDTSTFGRVGVLCDPAGVV